MGGTTTETAVLYIWTVSAFLVDVLLGQPIKLIQAASNSELQENQ